MMNRLPQIESPTEIWRVCCRRCGAYSRLAFSILDSQRGDIVHLYRCAACEEYMWDEARSQSK
jgi:formate dehydrogenase maturation protein FdhE